MKSKLDEIQFGTKSGAFFQFEHVDQQANIRSKLCMFAT
jgi:hypothetical protein